MRGDHSANAPGEGQGETDSPETSCMPGGRQLGWQEEAFGTAARTLLSHERSRLALEFLVGCFRARGWTEVILGFCSIQQLTQSRPGPGVMDKPLPRSIAVQFGEQSGNLRNQFFPLVGGKALNGGLNLLNSAHDLRLGPAGIDWQALSGCCQQWTRSTWRRQNN